MDVPDTLWCSWLTMTTCNPKFSARERLIITAELVEGPNVAYMSLLLEGRVQRRLLAPSSAEYTP